MALPPPADPLIFTLNSSIDLGADDNLTVFAGQLNVATKRDVSIQAGGTISLTTATTTAPEKGAYSLAISSGGEMAFLGQILIDGDLSIETTGTGSAIQLIPATSGDTNIIEAGTISILAQNPVSSARAGNLTLKATTSLSINSDIKSNSGSGTVRLESGGSLSIASAKAVTISGGIVIITAQRADALAKGTQNIIISGGLVDISAQIETSGTIMIQASPAGSQIALAKRATTSLIGSTVTIDNQYQTAVATEHQGAYDITFQASTGNLVLVGAFYTAGIINLQALVGFVELSGCYWSNLD